MKKLASILCGVAWLLAQGAPVRAGSSQTEISVDFNADTRDIHFRVAGHLTDGQDPRPTDLRGTGGFKDEIDNGVYNAAWNTAPGAASHVFTLKRSDSDPKSHNGTGAWDGKWWLTTDGNLKSDPPANAAAGLQTFASLYIQPPPDGTGGIAVYADNGSGATDLSFSNVVATVVTGLSSYDSPGWDTALGATFALPDTFVPAGNDTTFVGDLAPLGSDQWLRLNFTAGGVNQVFGYSIVPEPGTLTLSLIGLGLLAVIHRVRGGRRVAQPTGGEPILGNAVHRRGYRCNVIGISVGPECRKGSLALPFSCSHGASSARCGFAPASKARDA